MRQSATCSICQGRIWRYSIIDKSDAVERAPWLHSDEADWRDSPHNAEPVEGSQSEISR